MTCAVPLPSLCPSPPHALGFFAKGLSFAHLSFMSSISSFPVPGFDMAGQHPQRDPNSMMARCSLCTDSTAFRIVARCMMRCSCEPRL